MLDDVSFDGSNDKLIWGSIFTGIGFSLGMSCFLVQCIRRQCRKRRRRRPIVKTLSAGDSSDSSSSSDEESAEGIELSSPPPSDTEVEVKVESAPTHVIAHKVNTVRNVTANAVRKAHVPSGRVTLSQLKANK